ncbi:phosphotransferase family protein [Halegenticoccus soli]|uniref:phosphotransferase family protein n=1 Tax=Halegenticoccus soli TaxID=1985678 RepID=UPI000C6CEBB4
MSDADRPDGYFERLVDEDALRSYLAGELGEAEPFAVERHDAGHSNETLFATWGDRDLVIRRPPPGEVAETAHDVLREYRVVDALQGTEVPVPPTVLACEDHGVLGCDFYVMERVEGDVLRESEPERFAAPGARRRIGEELVDALATIHGVDYEAVGLGDFGRPAGYTERQVERWRKQLAWAFERTREEREVPALEAVGEWLADNVPESHPETLVHGDYKLDNVMFAPAGRYASGNGGAGGARGAAEPEIVAVFDWELSTLGDPLSDLGWLLAFWRDEGDPEPAVPELMPTFMAREGYPTRRELAERYEERTGIAFENDRFYRALAVYKLAALGEMFLRRHLEGNSSDPLYPKMGAGVPALADRAVRIVDGDEEL